MDDLQEVAWSLDSLGSKTLSLLTMYSHGRCQELKGTVSQEKKSVSAKTETNRETDPLSIESLCPKLL